VIRLQGQKIGYLLCLPYFIHFLLFMAYPIGFSLFLVFHKWDIVSFPKWVGVDNFIRLLRDELFFKSLLNTFFFLSIHIPLQIAAALLFAELLNRPLRLRGFFRAVYFLPVVVSGVAVTVLWGQLYAQETGLINALLWRLGLGKIPWLNDPTLAMPSIAIMATWKNVGLYTVLFLAGLQSIPRDLYEVARIEGASPLQQFFRITLPLLNPTVVLVVLLSTIGGFSLFIEPYVLTGGGPLNSTLSAVLYIYKQAFYFYRMGYAATLGLIYALIIMGVVMLQRRFVEREVY